MLKMRYERYAQMDNERQYRNELERQRHMQEMQLRHGENHQQWNDRQKVENQQYDQNVKQIEADLVAMFLNRQM